VSSRGFSLISSIVVARLLGKEGFGQWGLILTTVAMFVHFASFGVAMAATKHIAELRRTNPSRAGRTLSFLLLVGLTSVSAMALTCLGVSNWLARSLYKIPELSTPLMLASLMMFGMLATQMLQGALAGFEDFKRIAWINLVQGMVLLAAAVPLTWWLGLSGTVIGVAISWCAALALCLIATFKRSLEEHMVLSLGGISQEFRLLWQYGLPSLLSGAIVGPAMMLSQAIVANVPAGVAGLGAYNAAARWRDAVLFIPQAVRRVTLPMLSRLKGEDDYRRFMKALWANIALNGGIALCGAVPIMVLSPWILGLYGANFRQDWDILVVLAGAGICQAVNDVVTQVTAAMEKMWWYFYIHMAWGTILLGGSYMLVPEFGVRGYVWSLAAAVFNHMLLNSIAACIIMKRARVT
jgi:O-antigen/teichoic acid export membrane protein